MFRTMHGHASVPQLIDVELLLRAYALGLFPMADDRDDPDIFWVEPEVRAILPLDGFHLSKSLRKTLKSDKFQVRCDGDFDAVISACAQPTAGREQTWISRNIELTYRELHRRGYAHSVECWLDGTLVGGLYGVEIGGLFCGESMFSTVSDASKVALAALVAAMRRGGFKLLDCQFMTSHLASLGAIEISQVDYLALLDGALEGTEFGARRRPRLDYPTTVGAPSSGASSSPLVSAFESLLGAEGAAAGASSEAGASSPGKLIAQSFTQTS